LISWLLLRGRCANCGSKIAFRYFAVELLTALLFLAIWQGFAWQVAIAYWIFVSLLIVGTFIDFEHFIIPDRVTIGGIVAGVVCSVTVPALMETDSRIAAGVRSMLAAALGYVILLIVLEAGKIAFGRKKIRFDTPTPFTWTKREDDADFVVGSEQSLWSDHFAREKDRLLLQCGEVKIDNHTYAGVTLDFHYDRVAVEGTEFLLDHLNEISGVARELVIPRVQSFCRIASWIDHRFDHTDRRQAHVVGKAAFRALSGVRRGKLDVFWRSFSALVCRTAQSVMTRNIGPLEVYVPTSKASVRAAAEALLSGTVARAANISLRLMNSHFHQRRSPRQICLRSRASGTNPS
jgi:prepilin signal peptidase PulO-like enzyme (type II secretory pathway)